MFVTLNVWLAGLLPTVAVNGRLVGKLEALHVKFNGFRRWPCSPDDPDACHFQPEFSKWELSTDLVVPVPEPSPRPLLALGVAAFLLSRRVLRD